MSYQYGELKGQGHMYIPSPGMIINHSLFGSGSCSAGQGSHLSPNTFSPGHGTAKLKKAGTPGERLRLGLEALLSQGRGPGGEIGPEEAMSPRGLDLSIQASHLGSGLSAHPVEAGGVAIIGSARG